MLLLTCRRAGNTQCTHLEPWLPVHELCFFGCCVVSFCLFNYGSLTECCLKRLQPSKQQPLNPLDRGQREEDQKWFCKNWTTLAAHGWSQRSQETIKLTHNSNTCIVLAWRVGIPCHDSTNSSWVVGEIDTNSGSCGMAWNWYQLSSWIGWSQIRHTQMLSWFLWSTQRANSDGWGQRATSGTTHVCVWASHGLRQKGNHASDRVERGRTMRRTSLQMFFSVNMCHIVYQALRNLCNLELWGWEGHSMVQLVNWCLLFFKPKAFVP